MLDTTTSAGESTPVRSDSAQQIATFYAEYATRIRIGLMISMLGAELTFPFTLAIFMRMRGGADGIGPTSMTQLVIPLSVFASWWFVTAYVLLKGLKAHEQADASAVDGPVTPATIV